jgi:NADH-quinone oxidoreductase subunit N
VNEKLTGIAESLGFAIPELILSCAILVLLFAGLFGHKRNAIFNAITLLAAISSFAVILHAGFPPAVRLFNGMLQREGLGDFLMLMVDIALVLSCLMSVSNREKKHVSEYYALLLSVALGSHLLLMSTSFVMMFLSLELISLASYVLAGYSFDKQASEASLKYFLFGSVASATMLYGFTVLYGMTGTLDYTSPDFFNVLINHPSRMLLIAGFMGLAGFLFKMAAVPMHSWAPDVYQAAPIPVIAFLSVAPKLAALGIITKFLLSLHLFGQGVYDWQSIIAVVSIVTITVGNFSALSQKNPKRMMGYSSIAQSGFLLVGVATFLPEGVHFMLFYAAIYLLMNFAVFIYLEYFEKQGVSSMHSFSGQGRVFVWASSGLAIALVALTGLPPTAGFTAKLFIFSGLWEAYEGTHKSLLLWLFVFGLLNTVVSLFYYLRIPYFAFIRAGEALPRQKSGRFQNFLGLILVVLIVAIFFMPGLLMGWINKINFVL